MSGTQKSTQQTLFQTWKKKDPGISKQNAGRRNRETFSADQVVEMACEPIDLTDDDLIEAAEMLESTAYDRNSIGTSSTRMENTTTSFTVESIAGFDNSAGHIWIYPTNYPVRDYQFSIVRNSLFKNTLVSLPTGLGKTFIAAVVMYNFFRWYPQGKIVFMAPTKPLVSQQIEACYNIMGIPMEDQAEITGMNTPVHKRETLWKSKRVFFLTPQVINNDLARGVCPASQIKCVVIDEAHKAQGKHAYCQVVNQIASCNRNFRVLALSATPGTDVKSVQLVISNLLISHIEIRSEDSIDIQQFSHRRNVEKVVCKLDETITKMRDNFLKVVEIFTKSLVNKRALFDRDTSRYSKYGLLMARDQFRKDPPSGLNKYETGAIEGEFATCISLYHGLDLLLQHGMRSFFIFLKSMMEGDKGNMRAKSVLGANNLFREIYSKLKEMFGDSPNPTVLLTQAGQAQQSSLQGAAHGPTYVYSHPKMARLEEVVVKHFQNFTAGSENDATRVMVFCQYRDSVQELTELLQKHRPLIRPMQFVGHSTTSGKVARFTQKDQLQVVSKFRSGGYNTLVSTCVGEEGLDIGDVDLIVCFDAHKSPIRLVQRMGRTGRKRKGRIVMLVTEGKEERDYNSSLANKKSIQKAITGNSSRSLQFYQHNPRMVPVGLNPQPYKMFITIEPHLENNIATKGKKIKTKAGAAADISVMMKNADQQNSVFLDSEQTREWNMRMKLSAKEKEKVKVLPVLGRMVSLKRDGNAPNLSHKKNELSLSEWSDWQNRLQYSGISGHSTTTKNFAEIMEICDLVKRSDDDNFEENLAPFLGGKYDKQKMEEKGKSKIDTFLVPKGKIKILNKIKEAVRETDPNPKFPDRNDPPSFSSDTDFIKKPPKKVFPKKNLGFKNKLSIFTVSDGADFEDEIGDSDDDTMAGIDSILPDPVVADESSNESFNDAAVAKHEEREDELAKPMEERAEIHSDLETATNPAVAERKGGYKVPNTVETRLMSERCSNGKKIACPVPSLRSDIRSHTSDCTPQKMNIPHTTKVTSPYLRFVDDLPSLATPSDTPSTDVGVTSNVPAQVLRIPTPPSFDSISLDFLDDMKIVTEDDAGDAVSKPKTRACFSLGDECDGDTKKSGTLVGTVHSVAEPVDSATGGSSKSIEPGHATSIMNSNKCRTVGGCDRTLNTRTNSPATVSESKKDFSSKQHQKFATAADSSKLITSPEIAMFPLSQVARCPSPRQQKSAGSQTIPHQPIVTDKGASQMDVSFDMFASQMDAYFDFGDVFDSSQGRDKSEMTSPVLVSRSASNQSKFRSAGNSSKSKCESSENDAEASQSLARGTLTQRSENRVLFADLPKLQNDDRVLVAKVKPRRSFRGKDEAPETPTRLQSPSQFPLVDDMTDDDDFIADLVPGVLSPDVSNCTKRKRQSPESTFEGFQPKRRKDLTHTTDANKCSAISKAATMKTPEVPIPTFHMRTGNSTESDESPLVVRRKNRAATRLPKVLFSQDSTSHGIVSEDDDITEREIHSVMGQKIAVVSHLDAKESPIHFHGHASRSRNLLGAKQNQHSTPKCAPVLMDDDDFLDDGLSFLKNRQTRTNEAGCSAAPKKAVPKTLKRRLGDFVEDEAEVSNDGVAVSSDELDHDDTEADEEMRKFVNDATLLTQHVGDASSVDEQAMYLRGPPGLFKETPKFQAHGGKFKLAFDVGKDMDVFSQEEAVDTSGYEEDSFICDDLEPNDDVTALGEVTLLQDVSNASHSKKRVTRRQAELHKLRKMNYDASPVVKKEKSKKDEKQGRKRIVCMDDSTDSVESADKTTAPVLENCKDQDKKWTCAACTLLNPASSQICELCDSEKSPKQSSTSSSLRACKMCTYLNRGGENSCEMCGEQLEIQANSTPGKDLHKTKKPQKIDTNKYTKSSNKITDSVTSPITMKTIKSESNRLKEVEEASCEADNPLHRNDSPVFITATPALKGDRTNIRKRLDVSSSSFANENDRASTSQLSAVSSTSLTCESREDRLKRSRMKQLEFRAKMERRRSQQASFIKTEKNAEQGQKSTASSTKASAVAGISTPTVSAKASLKFSSPNRSLEVINSSISTPAVKTPNEKDKKVILIDSKELSSSQPIITSLRCKHNVHVVVASLPHCDYIVGKGTAVERKVFSDFSQVSNRQKLVSRFQQLNANYSRVYLIIEQDRVKKNDVTGGRRVHSSYYHSTICSLTQTNVRIVYSDCQEGTAAILHSLVSREKSLKRSIDFDAAEKANDAKCRTLLKIYTSIPRVSFVSAIYLCLNYKSFKEVASSSVEKLMQRAHMTTSSAAEVYNFFRRSFDLQMTPSK